MVSFFFLFTIFSFSHDPPSKKLTYIISSTNHLLSDIGFYDILVRGGETITGILSNGDNRLFIVIPSHPDFSIESISIDDQSISSFSGKRGFAINGKENATFKIKSTDTDSILQVNAWLIPSQLCSNSAFYTYGSRKIKYEKVISIQDFCAFSPTLDSKNNKFTVKFGIKNGAQSHESSLYKLNFSNPLKKVTGTQIANYESGGPYFIQYNMDNSDSYTISYERKTKTIKFKDKSNKCTINPFYRCSLSGAEITCNDDQTGKDNSKSCSNSCLSTTQLSLIITFGTIALLGAIAGIVACSCLCSCCACCCCNRKKSSIQKKKVQNQKDSDDEDDDNDDSESEKSSKSDKSSESSKNSEKSENSESKSKSKKEKDDFDLYKQLKKLYQKQDKEIKDLQKQHLKQVEALKHQKQVTNEQDQLLESFKQQSNDQQQQENEQIKQLKDQQLQELLVLQQVQSNIDPLLS